MGLFDDQIRDRKRMDQVEFQDSFTVMAEAVMGKRLTDALYDEVKTTEDAMARILRYYHIKPVEVPKSIKDRNQQIEYIIQPKGIMSRTVKLTEGWHKDAIGAMLGVLKEDGKTVALIPRKTTGYYYLSPVTGRKEKVCGPCEALFEEEALLFYPPLPLGKLTIKDLKKYMLSTLSEWDIAILLAVTAAATMVGLLLPIINKLIFGQVLSSSNARVLGAIGCFLISVTICKAMMELIRTLILDKIVLKMDIAIESASMMRLLSLPASFFKKFSSGDLSRRLEYLRALYEAISEVMLTSSVSSLFSLIYIIQIFIYARQLIIPAILVLLLMLIVAVLLGQAQAKFSRTEMEYTSKESGTEYSIITGIQKIKIAGAEKRAFAKWAGEYAEVARAAYDSPSLIRLNAVLATAITLLGTIAIYIFAIAYKIPVDDYLAFDTAFGMASVAFVSLSEIILMTANIRPMLDMAEPIFNEKPEVTGNRKMVRKLSGRVELNHLSFRYSPTMPLILDDVSLSIKNGEYIAVVGDTGCGKSTLIRLLLGFESPQKGSISYDNRNINELDLKSLRKNIGVVTQNGKLFLGDIYSNIALSDLSLSEEDVWEAAEIAGIADDIRQMPMGMHTVISDSMGVISGGQKQRIMIARAVVASPKILIFDEATSALDNISQKKISDALDSLNCTRIVIAHRLTTIKQCDRIIVLKNGNIVEDGTYETLIEKNGHFAELIERQRVDSKN
ncbi:MAG: ATP-binding cassette domain-containing protein [Clostridiales bacterium]|jgi:NHLM bacteriocin system ABC transporter ATP-binding protein|nr:ATP-binding cassette domain-containing protein [Clostridiales bacterium]